MGKHPNKKNVSQAHKEMVVQKTSTWALTYAGVGTGLGQSYLRFWRAQTLQLVVSKDRCTQPLSLKEK